MKPEAIIAKYADPSAPVAGKVSAVLSPGGWESTRYESVSSLRLRSDEITEFTDVVMGFFRTCNTQRDLKKFVRRYGTEQDAVTSAFRLDGRLMEYFVRVAGYAVVFEAYRKENV